MGVFKYLKFPRCTCKLRIWGVPFTIKHWKAKAHCIYLTCQYVPSKKNVYKTRMKKWTSSTNELYKMIQESHIVKNTYGNFSPPSCCSNCKSSGDDFWGKGLSIETFLKNHCLG